MIEVIKVTSEQGLQGQGEAVLSMVMPFNGQVRDPIYGYIDFVKELEGVVMDSWVLQRLRYIYQLQTAHFVYPGATHTRFSHSIGVMYSSHKYASFVLRTGLSQSSQDEVSREVKTHYRELVTAARILGLLHDIGHGPFSHAFDKYVYKTRSFLPYRVGNHEVVSYLLYRDYLRDLIEKSLLENKKALGMDVDYLLGLLDSGLKPPSGMKGFTDLVAKGLLGENEFYDGRSGGLDRVVRMIVRDYIYTSDIMDYLKRDSYYTGVPVGEINDDWIMRNSYIVGDDTGPTLGVSSKALDEVARLFDARKLMYKYVYLHPVNVAFIETIGMILECIKTDIASRLEKMIEGRLEEYIALTDHSLYSKLQELLLKNPSEYECEDKTFTKMALESLFYHRKPIWKLVKRFTYDLEEAKVLFGEIGDAVRKAILDKIKREVAGKLSHKGVSENDIYVLIDKIDVFPSAGEEVASKILVVDVKDGEVVDKYYMSFNEFAREYGLKSEVLISLYINRVKYRELSGRDLEEVISLSRIIIENSIKGRKREAPETS